MAKANALILPATVGTFTLRKPNGDKGSEADDTDEPVEAYARKGFCFGNHDYYLVEVCAGDDTAFEVFNPERRFRGVATAAIGMGVEGPVEIYVRSGTVTYDATGEEVDALNDLDIDVGDNAVCEVVVETLGTDVFYRITNADYACP
jgi:hypothetical protein